MVIRLVLVGGLLVTTDVDSSLVLVGGLLVGGLLVGGLLVTTVVATSSVLARSDRLVVGIIPPVVCGITTVVV